MPKLPSKVSNEVQQAEASGGSFEPLKPGKYMGTLEEVTAEPHPKFGNVSIWVAVFGNLHSPDGTKHAGRQWLRLNVIGDRSIPSNYDKGEDKWGKFVGVSDARLKQFFESMGYTVDSDTDEMLNEPVVLNVGQRVLQQGNRAGETVNEVRGLSPANEADEFGFEPDSIVGDSGGDDGDNF